MPEENKTSPLDGLKTEYTQLVLQLGEKTHLQDQLGIEVENLKKRLRELQQTAKALAEASSVIANPSAEEEK